VGFYQVNPALWHAFSSTKHFGFGFIIFDIGLLIAGNLRGRWVYGMIVSATKRLMFKVLFFS
jgi:hypothetical protein